MSIVTREQAMNALFALLQTATWDNGSGPVTWLYTSRRPMTQQSLGSMEQPAMILIDDDEGHTKGDQATKAVRKITCAAWCWTAIAQDPTSIPATEINNIIDSIDPNSQGVLMANQLTGKQTLGGLVYDCYIDGKLTKDPGVLGGLGFAHIPITIVLP